MIVKEIQAGMDTLFQYYGRPITNVELFKYLVRLLVATYNYWPVVVENLFNSCKKWSRLSSIPLS